jgi:hypothetical protein
MAKVKHKKSIINYTIVFKPGGPTRRAPFGIFAPKSAYFFGFFRKSTNSTIEEENGECKKR